MTTEEKAKAYDEALIKGSRLWECGEITRENYEYIFPELKESEDEKMIRIIEDAICTNEAQQLVRTKYGLELSNLADWLEKQHEKKSDDIQSIEERAYQVFPDDGDENTPLYRQAFIDGAVDYIDGGCTKSAWNEEDTIKLKSTIAFLRNPNTISSNIVLRDKTIEWLQSLRPQNSITDEELAQAKKQAYNDVLDKIEYHSGEPTFDDGWSAAIWYLKNKNAIPKNTLKPSDLPHWKKSTLPNDNTTGFNSDYFCHKGYSINYKELFEKLPKDD